MVTRTLSECSFPFLAGSLLFAASALTQGCGELPAPTLSKAFSMEGNAAERARSFAQVALQGRPEERRRAAFLWGLYACDAKAPRAAITAFRIAAPPGGRRVLAARRLEATLEASGARAELWRAAASAAWLSAEQAGQIRVAGAEMLLARGDSVGARLCLGAGAAYSGRTRERALAVLARLGDPGSVQQLAIEFPDALQALPSAPTFASVSAHFSTAQWLRHAEAQLTKGEPARALTAARRAGTAGTLVGIRAALRLRRPSEALAWADRADQGKAATWLERAEAWRQLAWAEDSGRRRPTFGKMLDTAQRVKRLATGAGEAGRAGVLAAEALAELGRFADAETLLKQPEVRAQPRFEWVWRRLALLRSQSTHALLDEAFIALGSTTRGRRVASYWRAAALAKGGEEAELRTLAAAGFEDLPAIWARSRLGLPPATVQAAPQPPRTGATPRWAMDLILLGRVADAIVGFRAELELRSEGGPGWLALARLAKLPPLDAIPILVRGEPRLLVAEWQGLPRELLESYLPLPYRDEVERAAHQSGVPAWLLAGMVRQESAWYANAVSTAGAVGLAQVLPSTGREIMRQRHDLFPVERSVADPAANLLVGALLLDRWRRSFGGSWTAALAAYNAGERRVREIWQRCGRTDGPEFVESLEIPETWDYVHRVVMLAEGYRSLYWPNGRGYPWT